MTDEVAAEFRGRGFGTTAQWLLVDHLFATTDRNRVLCSEWPVTSP